MSNLSVKYGNLYVGYVCFLLDTQLCQIKNIKWCSETVVTYIYRKKNNSVNCERRLLAHSKFWSCKYKIFIHTVPMPFYFAASINPRQVMGHTDLGEIKWIIIISIRASCHYWEKLTLPHLIYNEPTSLHVGKVSWLLERYKIKILGHFLPL